MATAYTKYVTSQIQSFVDESRVENPDISPAAILEALLAHEFVSKRCKIDPTTQCGARVWKGFNEVLGKDQAGYGGQCGKSKISGGEFCKRCSKSADITREPCSYWSSDDTLPANKKVGDKKGLFFGEWAKPFPYMAADGTGVALVWHRNELKKEIALKMADGVGYHPNTKEFKSGRTAPPRLAGISKTKKTTKAPKQI